jgi:mRNA-degrading endonuclease RelE of RelBE toxin-antitoxin system
MMHQLIIPNSVAKDVKRLDKPVQRLLRDDLFPRLKETPWLGEPCMAH